MQKEIRRKTLGPKRRGRRSGQKTLAVLVVLILALSGCGLLESGNSPMPSGDSEMNLPKIGLVTDEGGIEDPYYQKAWKGLQKAEQDLKLEISYVKAKNDKDYPSKLAELNSQKADVIFTIGSQAVPDVLEAAKKTPKIKYVCLDSNLESPIPSNVLGVSYKIEEGAFLAGYLAGKTTKSRVAGYISGDNKEESQRYYYGFKTGLRLSNSGCELMKGIAGTFTNKKRVEKMVERMIESKADVIFHNVGSAGKSVIKEMDKASKYSIGVDVDQNELASESVITSVVKNNDEVIYEILKKLDEKSLILGKNLVYGLGENGVSLAESTKDIIPETTYNLLLQQQEKIIAGKLKIPTNESEYLNFSNK